MSVTILAVCGSSRRGSFNQQLLAIAAASARDRGARISMLDLRELDLPIYDGDLEVARGLPDGALKFKAMIAEHQALLIGSPEHNGGHTALLKNALDWASRPTERDVSGLGVFAGKIAAIVSASPGPLGGVRSQLVLQVSLSKLGVLVIPNSFALSAAHQAFDRGRLKDPTAESMVRAVGVALVESAHRLGRPVSVVA